MKAIVLVFTIFIFISIRSNAQDPHGANASEKKVLAIINSLPEVVKENNLLKRAHSKFFLKAFIQNTPTKNQNYYSVSISEDLGFQLRTYDWYEVNPQTFHIRYWDIAAGKVISLKQWRKQLENHKKFNRQKLKS